MVRAHQNVEFYNFEDEVWIRSQDGTTTKLTEQSDIVPWLCRRIEDFYPQAYRALHAHFAKLQCGMEHKAYRIAALFCKCNFGNPDCSSEDIDSSGTFRFEHVSCPMRGECKMEGIVCHPKFEARLSKGEKRVLRLLYNGLSYEEIGERLFLSPLTCRNHVLNAYKRIGVADKAGFVRYAVKHGLFKDDKDED